MYGLASEKLGLEPDSLSKAAMCACERAGMWEVCLSLFEEMDVRPGYWGSYKGSTI